jgi:hypothetical protein
MLYQEKSGSLGGGCWKWPQQPTRNLTEEIIKSFLPTWGKLLKRRVCKNSIPKLEKLGRFKENKTQLPSFWNGPDFRVCKLQLAERRQKSAEESFWPHLFVLHQGDQIGRIFAQWAIIYFGRFVENRKSSPYFCATFSLSTGMCICDTLIVTKIGLGHILGDFFHQLVWSPCSALKTFFFYRGQKVFLLRPGQVNWSTGLLWLLKSKIFNEGIPTGWRHEAGSLVP